MSDSKQDMRAKLDALLTSDLTDLQLVGSLKALAEENPQMFQSLADVWAFALYERDVHFYATFFSQHLQNRLDVIDSLLERVEADGHTGLYTSLYVKVATIDRWNAEILAFAQSDLDNDTLAQKIEIRGSYYYQWVKLYEETALALYARAEKTPANIGNRAGRFRPSRTQAVDPIRDFLVRCVNWGDHLAEGGFHQWREAARTAGDEEIYWALFRMRASSEEWHMELQSLVDEKSPNSIAQELQKRHISKFEMAMDVALGLIETYGESVISYFERNVPFFAKNALKTILQIEMDNQSLMQELNQLRWRNYQLFPTLAHIWAPALYERDPVFFEKFLVRNLSHLQAPVIRQLLPQIKADGYDSLYRSLYGYVARSDEWNAELLELAQSDLSDARVERAVDRLDVPTGYYYRQTNLMLKDEVAVALYQRNALLFRDFIRRYVNPNIYAKGEIQDYALLMGAVRAADDEEFYWILFRKLADSKAWTDELERLLAANIPGEQITEELEKRHPDNARSIKPAILSQFTDAYGEAVLPYFEKHISWVTQERLETLLNLPIDRGELRHELEAIARRERREFGQLADVWAMKLYQPESEFFDGFLRNYLDWSSEYTIRKLLPVAEADGKDELFTTLYRRVSRQDEWRKEVEIFAANQKMDDEAILASLERRDVRWYQLSDRAAVALYQRNAELFRPYIAEHLARYRPEQYKQLLKLARKQGDSLILSRLHDQTPQWDRDRWVASLQNLLQADDITPEAAAAELERVHPEQTRKADPKDAALIIDIAEKYGVAVYPYLEQNASWIAGDAEGRKRLLEMARAAGAWGTYNKLFFSLSNPHQWNQAIKQLLDEVQEESEFLYRLRFLTPPPKQGRQHWGWRWYLTTDNALELYRRYPDTLRRFVEVHSQQLPTELFELAEANRDEEFMDFITFQQMLHLQSLVWNAYPPPSNYYRKPNDEARQQIEETSVVIINRFNRLYDESPETYVRHAANILSRVRAFDIRGFEQQLKHNPIFNYLARKHHDVWRRSSAAILELMESTDIYVNLIGLEILSEGTAQSAERVIENVHLFRALLLGRTRINTKKKVLACLENAAWQGEAYAHTILPLLKDIIDFQGKRAISDDVMVAYVRLRAAFGAPTLELTD